MGRLIVPQNQGHLELQSPEVPHQLCPWQPALQLSCGKIPPTFLCDIFLLSLLPWIHHGLGPGFPRDPWAASILWGAEEGRGYFTHPLCLPALHRGDTLGEGLLREGGEREGGREGKGKGETRKSQQTWPQGTEHKKVTTASELTWFGGLEYVKSTSDHSQNNR